MLRKSLLRAKKGLFFRLHPAPADRTLHAGGSMFSSWLAFGHVCRHNYMLFPAPVYLILWLLRAADRDVENGKKRPAGLGAAGWRARAAPAPASQSDCLRIKSVFPKRKIARFQMHFPIVKSLHLNFTDLAFMFHHFMQQEGVL